MYSCISLSLVLNGPENENPTRPAAVETHNLMWPDSLGPPWPQPMLCVLCSGILDTNSDADMMENLITNYNDMMKLQ